MHKLLNVALVLSTPLLIGAAIFAAAETRPAERSGRLVKSIARQLDYSGKPTSSEAIKLNQAKLAPAGGGEPIDVKLIQDKYRCNLTDSSGKPLEHQYAAVSTLRSISPTSSYGFSFCAPATMIETPHTFRLFSHGPGKNYLVWTANRFIFLVEVSKGNERTETFMRHLCFHDPNRVSRQKAIYKQMRARGVKLELYDYLWRTQISQLVAADFGLTKMPDIINTPGMIAKDKWGFSRNSIREELFVISMSISKAGERSIQFVGPKTDFIYTVVRKSGQWRLAGTEALTKERIKELWTLLGRS